MTDKQENPRAFPLSVNDVGDCGYEGMTLRDYFAAKAMQTFVKISRDNYNHGNADDGGFSWVAEMSYKQAAAMLKVRQNEENT